MSGSRTTGQSSLFGGAPSSTAPAPASSTPSSIFASRPATTTSNSGSLFGGGTTSGGSLFGSTPAAAGTSTSGLFGSTPAQPATSNLFSSSSVFGTTQTARPTVEPVFGRASGSTPAQAPASSAATAPAKKGRELKPPRLSKLFNNQRHSDVTVIAGPEGHQENFHLHRAIICLSSEFFNAACKLSFKEGIAKEIKLPEIDPEVFKQIGQWMYDGSFELPDRAVLNETVLAVYKAADFLQIQEMKLEILEEINKALEIDSYTESVVWKITEPLDLIAGLCKTTGIADWMHLQKATRNAIMRCNIESFNLVTYARGEQGGSFFLALVVDAYQTLLAESFCLSCLKESQRPSADGCRKCRKRYNREDVSVHESDLT
ncbi:hypothetical protein ABW19_dt0202524 [Dactylella cylindrospora]|nr:hypothetical protein ABW19_dt0202524 [Dactylella cylindrospora]